MELSVTKPADFSEGVFLLEAVFTIEERSLSDGRFTFPLPELSEFPRWLFRGNVESGSGSVSYSYPSIRDQGGRLGGPLGLFENGRWEFILQSNGCAVVENPDSLEAVIAAVRRNIQAKIDELMRE